MWVLGRDSWGEKPRHASLSVGIRPVKVFPLQGGCCKLSEHRTIDVMDAGRVSANARFPS